MTRLRSKGQGRLLESSVPFPLPSSQQPRYLSTTTPPNLNMSEQAKFIVVFKKDVTPEQIDEFISKNGGSGCNSLTQDGGIKVTNSWYKPGEGGILNGFAAELHPGFASSLEADSLIDYIEPDGIVTTQ
ncbi:hypothetical protein BKA70DRAFT_1271367 [Coprinopsis sp. MPI-PUGE-AT-0042]|nr:hypothetical protein BKA70DRAFT_1271367 [Coprinopsis sp. MPI-PUGE-AT-0042]